MLPVTDRLGGLVDRLRLRRERGGGLRTTRAFSASPSWDKENQANSVSNEKVKNSAALSLYDISSVTLPAKQVYLRGASELCFGDLKRQHLGKYPAHGRCPRNIHFISVLASFPSYSSQDPMSDLY